MDGDTITAVEVVSNSETPEIAGAALEQIPAAIVAANSPDVDVVSGAPTPATASSTPSRTPVSGTSPEPEPEATPEPTQAAQTAAEAYQGFGLSNTVRMGPGSDDTGTPVYSINQVFANVVFDGEGKILSIYVDQLEYATPNYDGAVHAPLQRLARTGAATTTTRTTTPWWTAPLPTPRSSSPRRSQAGSPSATGAMTTSWVPAPGTSRWMLSSAFLWA